MSKIEEGARVKVRHDPGRDVGYLPTKLAERRVHNGEIGCVAEGPSLHARFRVRFDDGGAWYDLAELTPVETAPAEGSVRVKIGQAVDNVDRALDEERLARCAAVEAARNETTLVRADLEALQAAVRGLTGKEGTVADMVSALADVGRSRDVAMVAALRRDRDDALRCEARAVDTLVTARELFEALRAQVQSERSWIAAHPGWERLGRALRGEKAPQDPESEPAKDPQTAAIEAIAETVESISEHVAALEQQIAGLGNRLDEVRDPAWFASRFREHMRPKPAIARHIVASAGDIEGVAALAGMDASGCDGGHPGCSVCDAASVAEDRPRVSWKWADHKTSGWLTTATGEQIAGAHEGNGGWYWWARGPRTESVGNVGPMTERAAIESAEAAARIQGAEIVQ
jgi:hypothetical protein